MVGLLPVARHPPPPPQPSPADLAAASGHAREVMERELKPGSASSRDSWTDVNGTTFGSFCSLSGLFFFFAMKLSILSCYARKD